ncbi:MAG: thermostable hemolysin, partial [Gammaproteobacteria bacterium]
MDKQEGIYTMQAARNLKFENPITSLARDKTQFFTLIHKSDDPSSYTTKEFIKADFLKHHNAQIKEFMPNLVTIINKTKNVRAVVGYRKADENKLFLEQYLDKPIEEYISKHCGM